MGSPGELDMDLHCCVNIRYMKTWIFQLALNKQAKVFFNSKTIPPQLFILIIGVQEKGLDRCASKQRSVRLGSSGAFFS